MVHGGGLTEAFDVKSGTRQGCMLSPLLFLVVIDWVTRHSVDIKGTGIHWISEKCLQDLEFADNLAPLSHSSNHMQEKTQSLKAVASSVGLRIKKGKTKLMKMKTNSIQSDAWRWHHPD